MSFLETGAQRLVAALYFLPAWMISLVLMALAIALALFVHRMAFAVVKRLVAQMDLFWRSLVSRTHGPTRFAFVRSRSASPRASRR